jgi:TolB-like protein/Tfp pilus assembly protein PilF/tRNA A-37 threonylcarbamoyl transferase component Bud32
LANKCPTCHSDNPDTLKFCGECGTQLPPPKNHPPVVTETLHTPIHELAMGSTLAGRYQIIEELGKGGMGRVYKVFDTKIKEKVAIKLIKPEVASDKDTIERFNNEIRLARRIGHRNVCKMFDIGEAEGAHFITMEYVHGEDLKSMIEMSGSLSLGMLLSVGKQACDGLAEAHSLGVVHRDLKPQNIMIDKHGNAKIMDFGIARSVREKGITGPSVMIGTPEYMSPEQVEAKDVDHRSDIYSLGVILYEMATSHVPFEGETALSIAMKHKGETPKDPKQLNPNIPANLSAVLLKCLEKDRAKRYQSALDLRGELDRIEKGLPTAERVVPERKPITSRQITVQFSPKKLFVPALAVVIMIAAAVVLLKVLPKKGAGPVTIKPGTSATAAAAKMPKTEKMLETEWKRSIAVLPFSNLSMDEEQEPFCDGLSEDISNALSHIRQLRVVARTSAFAFKGKAIDVREVGEKLNVDTVLEGSVQKAGDRLKIMAQLINVADGYQLWSERFDRTMKDVLDIQDEVTLEIVDKLKIELLGKERDQVVKRYTANMEAYNLLLKGRYFWAKRSREGLKKGMECVQQALEIDPAYALAYAYLASNFNTLGIYGYARPHDVFPKAKAAARKALELDSSLPQAHTALAFTSLWYDWEWAAAEKGFEKALSLNPGSDYGLLGYYNFLTCMGRFDEALLAIQKTLELDPISVMMHSELCNLLRIARRYDEAQEQCQKTIEMDPNYGMAHFYRGQLYVDQGRYGEAVPEFQKAIELTGGLSWAYGGLGYAYAMLGQKAETEKILHALEERSTQEYIHPTTFIKLYYALGDIDKSFDFSEKAMEERDPSLTFMRVLPEFDVFRADPRFKALLKKMNLDE